MGPTWAGPDDACPRSGSHARGETLSLGTDCFYRIYVVYFLYSRSSLFWEVGDKCGFIPDSYSLPTQVCGRGQDSWHPQQEQVGALRSHGGLPPPQSLYEKDTDRTIWEEVMHFAQLHI